MQPAKNSVVKLEPRSVTLKNLSTREPCAPTRREVGSGGGGWAGAALADRGQHVLQVLQVRAQEARLEPEVDLVVLALLPALLELGGPRRIGLIHLRHRSGAWVRGTQAPDGHSKRRKLTASTFIKTRRGTIPNSLLRKKRTVGVDNDTGRNKSLCGGGVPFPHPSLGLCVFLLSFFTTLGTLDGRAVV